jgi:pilus assembly protein Flp/PilA
MRRHAASMTDRSTPNTGEHHMYLWKRRLLGFLKEEDGPTAVEYAVMLALIILVCFATIGTFGQTVNSLYEEQLLKSAFKN